MMVAKMPDRFWAFEDEGGGVPRSGFWIDEQSECPEGSPEYARVSPDTITLPRAEVEDVADTLNLVADWMEKSVKDRRIIGPEFHVPTLRKALATLQERMK